MPNLKEARAKGKLEEFIKEHEKDPKGDKDRLEKTIESFTQGSQNKKSTQETSSQD